MAKMMARIEDNIVINMEWCINDEEQTDALIDVGERSVCIGDTYDGESFFRDGVKVMTPLEAALAKIEQLEAEKAAMEADQADMAEALALLGYHEAEVLNRE